MPVQPEPPDAVYHSLSLQKRPDSNLTLVANDHVAIGSDSLSSLFTIDLRQSPAKVFDNLAPPLRPLSALVFAARPPLHHSLVLQIDGLLHACFRLLRT